MAKIYIFSGEDIVNSRKAYLGQIELFEKQNQEIVHLPAKEISEESIENIFGGNNLFGLPRAIVTENFFSGQKSKEKDSLRTKILSFPEAVLISWEEKEITKAAGEKLGNDFVIKNFDLPKILWKFLDDLSPKNKSQNLKTFHQLIIDQEPHFIFSMIIRQFRLLIQVIDEEVDGLPPWQRGKLSLQANEFGKEKLIYLYKNLLEIDTKQKTSSSPIDLTFELDLLILGL